MNSLIPEDVGIKMGEGVNVRMKDGSRYNGQLVWINEHVVVLSTVNGDDIHTNTDYAVVPLSSIGIILSKPS